MSFNGLLNRTCKIQKVTKTEDPDSGELNDAWTTIYNNVKCRLDEAKGKEFASPNSILALADHVLFLNYGYVLKAGEHQIVIGADSYNILLVKNAGGEFHHLELMLQRIK